ncbi:MAG: type II secretion system protein N [Pseudomonadota bacterium]
MSRRWRYLLFAGLVAAFLLATAPLRLAVSPLFARVDGGADMITGTLWRGRLIGAHVAGATIGDTDIAINALPLLIGETELGLSAPSLRGKIEARGDALRVSGLRGTLAMPVTLGPVTLGDADPQNVELTADGVDLDMRGERCVAAAGPVRARLKADGPSGAPFASSGGATAGSLAGQLSCRDGTLFLPLGGQGARITLSLAPGGQLSASAL